MRLRLGKTLPLTLGLLAALILPLVPLPFAVSAAARVTDDRAHRHSDLAAGRLVERLASNTTQNLYGLACPATNLAFTSTVCYASGTGGAIQKQTNVNGTWATQSSGAFARLHRHALKLRPVTRARGSSGLPRSLP